MKAPTLFLAVALVAFAVAAATQRDKNPVELGRVLWERDYDKAVARAKKSDRDLFVLFQEVPG